MKKTRNVCKETPTPFYQLNRETFWMMIDNKILNARSALYFYATLRCNLDTGTGHRIEYDHAANVLGFKKSTIYKAAIALEDAGFLKRNDSGGFIPYLPHIVSQKEFRETEKLRKKEQPFFEELHANIINFMNESGQTPGLAAIWHIYDNLCANRRARAKKLGKWTPETEGRIHIFRGLVQYAPGDSTLYPIYVELAAHPDLRST